VKETIAVSTNYFRRLLRIQNHLMLVLMQTALLSWRIGGPQIATVLFVSWSDHLIIIFAGR